MATRGVSWRKVHTRTVHVASAIVHHKRPPMPLLDLPRQQARRAPARQDHHIPVRNGPAVEIPADLEGGPPPEVVGTSHPRKGLHRGILGIDNHRRAQIGRHKVDGRVVKLEVVGRVADAARVGVEADAAAMVPSPVGREEAADTLAHPASR